MKNTKRTKEKEGDLIKIPYKTGWHIMPEL